MAETTVDAVVVTWQGAHLLPDCLDSLQRQTVAVHIIVVDNASTDGTTELMACAYPEITYLRLPTNTGFAGGVDAALAQSRAEFVFLLNNDATLAPDGVAHLLQVAQSDPTVAAVTAQILLARPDGQPPEHVNSTGNLITRRGNATDRDWMTPLGEESTDPDVFGFCGGAVLLRRAAVAQVGGFDPDLFLYYEDTDLSWKLRAAGWRIVYCPQAQAIHQHAASTGAASPVFRYYNTRNSLIVFGRHAPYRVVIGSYLRQSLGILRAALAGEPAVLIRARSRAIAHALSRLPQTARERTHIWSSATVTRAQVARFLVG